MGVSLSSKAVELGVVRAKKLRVGKRGEGKDLWTRGKLRKRHSKINEQRTRAESGGGYGKCIEDDTQSEEGGGGDGIRNEEDLLPIGGGEGRESSSDSFWVCEENGKRCDDKVRGRGIYTQK